MKLVLAPVSLLFLVGLGGCPSSSPPEDGKRTAELAEKLVTCQNERSGLKEQLGALQSEVRQLKTRAQAPAGGADAAGAAEPEEVPRAGRATPRARDGGGHAAVHRRGPDNPAAEAKAAQEMALQLRGQGAQLRPCYERGLKRNADLQFVNQIKVRVTVGPDGHARDIHVSPRTDSDMESCIVQLVSHWHVSPYKGQPVQVEMPVSLRVQGQ